MAAHDSCRIGINEATRSNIVRKMGDMMVLRRAGTNYTIDTTWQEISCGFEEINGGSSENIFGTRPQMGNDSGGARVMVAQARAPLGDQNGRPTVTAPSKEQTAEEIMEAQNAEIRNLKHTILQMQRSKKEEKETRAYKTDNDGGRFRGGYNAKRKPIDRHDRENTSPQKETRRATAKVARVEKDHRGYMLKTNESSSDDDEYSDDENEVIEGGTARIFSARVMVEDKPQSPLGVQTKPMIVDMLPDSNDEAPEDEDIQPRAILVDDLVDAKARPEPIIRQSPDVIPSRKYYILQKPSILRDGKPYSGTEGYMVVPEDIPALVQEYSDDDQIDNSPWAYGGPQKRELKIQKYLFTVKEVSKIVVAYGDSLENTI